MYIPNPLQDHRKTFNKTVDITTDWKTLTIIGANFAPLGFDVGPPVFGLDKRPARLEWERQITAVTM